MDLPFYHQEAAKWAQLALAYQLSDVTPPSHCELQDLHTAHERRGGMVVRRRTGGTYGTAWWRLSVVDWQK